MTLRLRHLSQINPGTPAFDSLRPDAELTFMPLETVWADTRLDTTRVATKASVTSGYVRFQDGDVLVPKTAPTFHHGRSTLVRGLLNGLGAGSSELHLLRPKSNADARFLSYVVRSSDFIREGVTAYQGVAGLQRVPADFLAEWPVTPWTLGEQRRIADFLDDQVARLDGAIGLRQRQLKLAQERLESHRDTFMDELDAQYLRIGQIACYLTDGDWIESPYITDSGIRLIQTGNVGRGEYRDQGFRYVSDQTFIDLNCTPVHPGDVLVSRLSPPVGRACLAPVSEERMIASVDVAILRSELADHRYLVHYFSTRRYLDHVSIASRGATMARISRSQLASFLVPLPSRSIQLTIADELDEAADATVQTTRFLAASIDLLQERKQALITAAVTGQLDVATAQAMAT